MKNYVLAASLAAITLAAPTAFAQSRTFEGLGVFASTGYNQYKVEGSGSSVSGITFDSANPAGGAVNAGLDYTMALGDSYRLGIAAEANLVNSSESTAAINRNGAAISSYTAKVKNYYQISLNPGVLIQKDTLAYAKLGYFSATVSITGESDQDQDGFLFGGGIKKVIDGNWYVFGEFNARSGSSTSKSFSAGGSADIKVGGYNALFGVGTTF